MIYSVSVVAVLLVAVNFSAGQAIMLLPGERYMITSCDFPGTYFPGSGESWEFTGRSELQLTCRRFDVPKSASCNEEGLSVDDGYNSKVVCGRSPLAYKSRTNYLRIEHYSTMRSRGGAFSCEVAAIDRMSDLGSPINIE